MIWKQQRGISVQQGRRKQQHVSCLAEASQHCVGRRSQGKGQGLRTNVSGAGEEEGRACHGLGEGKPEMHEVVWRLAFFMIFVICCSRLLCWLMVNLGDRLWDDVQVTTMNSPSVGVSTLSSPCWNKYKYVGNAYDKVSVLLPEDGIIPPGHSTEVWRTKVPPKIGH